MAATQHPTGESADEPLDGQPAPTPDEDGPHDVPDDKVIEKTLPTAPVGDLGRGSSLPRDKPQE